MGVVLLLLSADPFKMLEFYTIARIMPMYKYRSIMSAWTRIKDVVADAEMRRLF